jgi:4-hydroxy-tetrahydrodipicolinate reductase
MKNKPKIALIGYGSMGREVESLAKEKGFEITNIFEINNPIISDKHYDFDVAIDFSFPDSVFSNIQTLCKFKKNIVVGTTGWNDKKDEIRSMVEKADVGMVYASNFSIGMRMFFRIIEQASKLMNKVSGYDVFLHEIHHHRKKDSPSGTAISLADIIIENVDRKEEIITEKVRGRINPNELHVSSTRGGEIMGYHQVLIDSLADTIELSHRAKSRIGFADGSLIAADWVHGRKGFYDFDEVLKNIWLDK